MAWRLRLIHLVDMVDDLILRHRFFRVCRWVADSDWWGSYCTCK